MKAFGMMLADARDGIYQLFMHSILYSMYALWYRMIGLDPKMNEKKREKIMFPTSHFAGVMDLCTCFLFLKGPVFFSARSH